MTDSGQGGEDTAARPCLHCGGPVPPAKRRGLVKLFCRDACRAAHRAAVIRQAIGEVVAAMDQARDEMGRLGAVLQGAAQRLSVYAQPPKPRKRRAAGPPGGA